MSHIIEVRKENHGGKKEDDRNEFENPIEYLHIFILLNLSILK
jgi:hypothetical protein